MKLAVIGGAGVRVPLLAGGFARSTLHVDRIDLYDIDQPRLAVIAEVARRMAAGLAVHAHAAPEPCIEGADFVITSIRVGGMAQRARDEATCIAHGVVGQETIGPAGFAMALRTIPAMLEYGRLVARLAPSAWLVNFTNPVSIISQALHRHTGARGIGICDTPAEIFEDAAHALGLPPAACDYDYFGLNHLGWLREVTFQGEPQLGRLWDDDARLDAAYRAPLFERERLRMLRLLPTEYLYYYYRPEAALANLQRAGTSRGTVVAALTDALFADLASGAADPVACYRDYLAARDASYMQLESGAVTPRVKPDWAELSGYDRIALMTVSAIAGNTGAVLPLNVPNRGVLPFLDDDDVIETPCVVDAAGPHPRPVDPVPSHARALIAAVKEYERATVQAAISGTRDDAAAALAINPLVHSLPFARTLVDALLPSA
jgi:6-phospho-beta-glucosidase